MHRCAHLYESGRQCSEPVLDGSDFCEDHAVTRGVFADTLDSEEQTGPGRLVKRIAALLLLIIFLIPFYYTVKSLYATFAVEMGEAR